MSLRERVLARLRELGPLSGPPSGVSPIRWRRELGALCREGVLGLWSWQVGDRTFTPKLSARECPALHLYLEGPRWTP